MNTKYLICIVGPTAIGKTALSIALAKYYKTEIISADSRQFYKEMNIGTAVPSVEELKQVKHHFIQNRSIQDDYNVGAFEKDALSCIQRLYKEHDTLILVGGSGLYIDAVTEGLDEFPKIDPEVRKSLNEQLIQEGLESLQNRLKQLDPIGFELIAIDNPHRVIRALEVSIGSGRPYSSYLSTSKEERSFKVIIIGLDAERTIIYDRINARVDLMMSAGLLSEAERLKPFKHLNALNTVGYKELFNYLENKWTLEFAVAEIKKNSRRFAKRQLTWFKKNTTIKWFNYLSAVNDIIHYIEDKKKPR
ncbi:MAG: tRNA (adenosine(37)-N6)-dimethylallyltransferase MiaA [Bacteroidia bacterium]|nr:tRNA (adenosine(37)-N6)-dimethylallyltransferase MiaA [Bacteroidia bacterium]